MGDPQGGAAKLEECKGGQGVSVAAEGSKGDGRGEEVADGGDPVGGNGRGRGKVENGGDEFGDPQVGRVGAGAGGAREGAAAGGEEGEGKVALVTAHNDMVRRGAGEHLTGPAMRSLLMAVGESATYGREERVIT